MIVIKEPITKAAKPRRTPRRVERLSDQMSHAITVNFAKGIRTFKKKVSPQKLLEAWTQGSYGAVMATIPWEELYGDLVDVHTGIGDTVKGAAKPAIEALPVPAQPLLRYDLENPRIKKYMDTRIGDLVTRINRDTQTAIQDAVKSSFTTAATPRDIANQIKDSIGLLPQHERAVRNYMSGLYKSGATPSRVGELGSAYYDRLLDYRAMMIGRTEAANAANNGQLLVWTQAKDQGLVPPTAKKVWVVMGDEPCEFCEPMDGEAVGLDEVWILDDGTVCMIPNEAHPHCYCKMTLDYGEQTEAA